MSSNRRLVKGIGIFILLIGIVTLALAAVMFFGAPDVDPSIEDGALIAQMYAAILAVAGLFQLVSGIVGIRAAKHDGALKPFVYRSTFIVLINIAFVGLSFLPEEAGGPIWPYLIYAATAFSGVVFGSRAMKEAGLK